MEQRLWAISQPPASEQHIPGRVWYSLPHSPSAGSPGTRFLSEKSFQTEVNIRWPLSHTGVTPYPWCGCLQGQRPGQASRTERTSLFLVSNLLPCSHFLCFGVGNFFLFFTSFNPKMSVDLMWWHCGERKVIST